jgi:hypothetical protein
MAAMVLHFPYRFLERQQLYYNDEQISAASHPNFSCYCCCPYFLLPMHLASFIHEGAYKQLVFQPHNCGMNPLHIQSVYRNLDNFGILLLLSS